MFIEVKFTNIIFSLKYLHNVEQKYMDFTLNLSYCSNFEMLRLYSMIHFMHVYTYEIANEALLTYLLRINSIIYKSLLLQMQFSHRTAQYSG